MSSSPPTREHSEKAPAFAFTEFVRRMASIKQRWFRIRDALRTCEAPDAALTPHVSVQTADSPAGPEDALAQVVAHLQHFGYETRSDPNGWTFAQHPYRYNFCLRAFAHGIRFYSAVRVEASIGNSRAAWLDFLNTANDGSHVARFSWSEEEDGCWVRMRALVSGAYSRPGFALVIDMWHDDQDRLQKKPEFAQQSSAGDEEETVAVTVN